MRFAIRFLTVLQVSAAVLVSAQTTTNSAKYAWLEQASQKRSDFIHSQNAKLNAELKRSASRKPIESLIRKLYDQEAVVSSQSLKAGGTLKLIDRGLAKPTELVLVNAGKSEILFSSFSLKKNGSLRPLAMLVSPDENIVALRIAAKGSIDQMVVGLFDLTTRQFKLTNWIFDSTNWAWMSPRELGLGTYMGPGGTGLKTVDVLTESITPIEKAHLLTSITGWALYKDEALNLFVIKHSSDGQTIKFDAISRARQVIGADNNFVYVYAMGPNAHGEVRRVSRTPEALDSEISVSDVVIPVDDMQVRKVELIGGYVFLHKRLGANRKIDIYKLSSEQPSTPMPELVAQVPVPDCCSIVKTAWKEKGKLLNVTLSSALQNKITFVWNLESKSWDRDVAIEMLVHEGIKYKTDVTFAKSTDGTLVPFRSTYRADLKKAGNTPTLIEFYGGFEDAGYFDPYFSNINREFLKRGGILVGPALRGGNEFDKTWHELAMKAKKVNTFYDLISVAKKLVLDGWTKPAKIVSTGGSNGGLTATASALLAPGTFGLVIARAGVNDLLAKDRLNPEFSGWNDEYGSESDPKALPYLTALSPLELVANQNTTKFLLLDGLNDSRVNIAHSLKLASALEDLGGAPQNVWLNSVKNAGHAQLTFANQNIIAWRVNSIMWTFIFDTTGLKAVP